VNTSKQAIFWIGSTIVLIGAILVLGAYRVGEFRGSAQTVLSMDLTYGHILLDVAKTLQTAGAGEALQKAILALSLVKENVNAMKSHATPGQQDQITAQLTEIDEFEKDIQGRLDKDTAESSRLWAEKQLRKQSNIGPRGSSKGH